MKRLSGVAIINDVYGMKITYAYAEIDEQGNVPDNNKKGSFVPLTPEEMEPIKNLLEMVCNKTGCVLP